MICDGAAGDRGDNRGDRMTSTGSCRLAARRTRLRPARGIGIRRLPERIGERGRRSGSGHPPLAVRDHLDYSLLHSGTKPFPNSVTFLQCSGALLEEILRVSISCFDLRLRLDFWYNCS